MVPPVTTEILKGAWQIRGLACWPVIHCWWLFHVSGIALTEETLPEHCLASRSQSSLEQQQMRNKQSSRFKAPCTASRLYLTFLCGVSSHPISKSLITPPSHTSSSLSVLGCTQVYSLLGPSQVLSYSSFLCRVTPSRPLLLQFILVYSSFWSPQLPGHSKDILSFYLFLCY